MSKRRRPTHEENLAAYAEWEWHYAQVEAFVSERGHCHLGEHPAGDWLRAQLKLSTAGRLSPERQQRLASLGVSLDTGEAAWTGQLQSLRDYLARHRVPRKSSREKWLPEPLDGELAAWLREQRALHREGLLHPARARPLIALLLLPGKPPAQPPEPPAASQSGERHTVQWEARYTELAAFQQQHGHCDVPKGWPENPSLATWVGNQRLAARQNKLPPERLARLDALGLTWSPRRQPVDRRWEERYRQLAQFQQQHGHTRPPKSFDVVLWHWRHIQRYFRRKGRLQPERIARLDALGFEWEEVGKPWAKTREERWERQWEERYAQLIEFQRQHGTTHVTAGPGPHASLAAWVQDQRELEKRGGLRPDRRTRLDAIGFLWHPGRPTLDALWEERYAQLSAFVQQHGHTRVPKSFDKVLWHWRHVQREFRKKDMLKPERIARLDALGFEWVEAGKPWAKTREERWDRQWDEMYAQLIEFQRQHGTTHVVAGPGPHARLATWVGDQREREQHGGMRPDRKARLDAIGFLWHPGRPTLDALWEERYAQLSAFREQHGHTRVPKGFDKVLWHWRHVQREFRRKGKLRPERIARLDALGFEWEERPPRGS